MTVESYSTSATQSTQPPKRRRHAPSRSFDKALGLICLASYSFEQAGRLLSGPEAIHLLRLAEKCQAAIPALARVGR